MDIEPGEVYTVKSIAEEYAHIARALCSCGGRYQFERQMLQVRSGRCYDIVLARCARCGATREFVFDVQHLYQRRKYDA